MNSTYTKEQALEELTKRLGFKINPAELSVIQERKNIKKFSEQDLKEIATQLKPLQQQLHSQTQIEPQPQQVEPPAPPPPTPQPKKQSEKPPFNGKEAVKTYSRGQAMDWLEQRLEDKLSTAELEILQNTGKSEFTDLELLNLETEIRLGRMYSHLGEIRDGLRGAAEFVAARQGDEEGKSIALTRFVARLSSEARTMEELQTAYLKIQVASLKELAGAKRTQEVLAALNLPLPSQTSETMKANNLVYLEEAQQILMGTEKAIAPSSWMNLSAS